MDAKVLRCPTDALGRSRFYQDPKGGCSYGYEFSSAPAPPGWDATRKTACRDWKPGQVTLFGDVVPLVRCHHHGSTPLNLTVTGKIYWGKLNWEWMFIPGYRLGDERKVKKRPTSAPKSPGP